MHGFKGCGLLEEVEGAVARDENPKTKDNMNNFSISQIVKGKVAGLFITLGFRTIAGEEVADLKEINPENHDEFAPGEVTLPLDCIVAA